MRAMLSGGVVLRELFQSAEGHKRHFFRRRAETAKQRTSPAIVHHSRLTW
jgi:hypothetical protein